LYCALVGTESDYIFGPLCVKMSISVCVCVSVCAYIWLFVCLFRRTNSKPKLKKL